MSSFTKPLVLPGFQLHSNIGDFDAGFQGRGVGGGAVGAERPGIESAIGNLRAQLGSGGQVPSTPGGPIRMAAGPGLSELPTAGGFEGPNATANRFLSRIGRNAIPAINMTKPNFLGSGGNTANTEGAGGAGFAAGGDNPYLSLLRRRLGNGGGDLGGGSIQYAQ